MANRLKTLLAAMPAVSAYAASSERAGVYLASSANNLVLSAGGSDEWLTNDGDIVGAWLRFDFGTAKTLDSCLIGSAQTGGAGTIKDCRVQYSADASSWSTAGTFTSIFGVAANEGFAYLTWAPQSARYWRILVDAIYDAGTWAGCGEWITWNSVDLGVELDALAGLTLTGPNSTNLSKTELNDRDYGGGNSYGLYYGVANNGACLLDLDFGASYYVGGISVQLRRNDNTRWARKFDLYTSTDGTTWTWRENVTCPDPVVAQLQSIPFSRIYFSRYYRLVAIAGTNGWIWYEWFLWATLTPAAPSDPTSVTARASDTGTDIEVTWSEAAGDDNVVADLEYKVERRLNAGAWSTLTSTHPVTHYVDTSLAAGDYDYRVTAINKYHARESSAVQTSASVTSPAAAGGGAARSMMCGAGMRVS